MRLELDHALNICHAFGREVTIYLVNDAIHAIEHPAIGATLHPYERKIGKWVRLRAEKGSPDLMEIWADRPGPHVTNRAPDPKGSSSLFALEVALDYKGHGQAILCGVPMTPYGGHFLRKRPWTHATAWRLAWLKKLPRFRTCVRSYSGWTAEQLGIPSIGFLENKR